MFQNSHSSSISRNPDQETLESLQAEESNQPNQQKGKRRGKPKAQVDPIAEIESRFTLLEARFQWLYENRKVLSTRKRDYFILQFARETRLTLKKFEHLQRDWEYERRQREVAEKRKQPKPFPEAITRFPAITISKKPALQVYQAQEGSER